jgi:hypothetical protein
MVCAGLIIYPASCALTSIGASIFIQFFLVGRAIFVRGKTTVCKVRHQHRGAGDSHGPHVVQGETFVLCSICNPHL